MNWVATYLAGMVLISLAVIAAWLYVMRWQRIEEEKVQLTAHEEFAAQLDALERLYSLPSYDRKSV